MLTVGLRSVVVPSQTWWSASRPSGAERHPSFAVPAFGIKDRRHPRAVSTRPEFQATRVGMYYGQLFSELCGKDFTPIIAGSR